MNLRATASRTLGFSLVEVMIAMIIICVGMLGIAKLEAVVLSSTGSSRLRALVALQAESLADAMHADRDFWDGTSGDWTSTVAVAITVTTARPPSAPPIRLISGRLSARHPRAPRRALPRTWRATT